ncbi:MAG: phosphoglucomutase (alpha-D-glucose-1,6-bisphosphate-dependent) [Chitinophagales bacterium]|nr:phosphoglucomutase (alpha-D-glucose-1,6-bisphosphate-dependent) [Chitinophagales bacterium]MBP9704449.1 phosphoglucomutase (alpha-D-glucose-1,6-bisphosphate-dependent) [Chitinophagales bacterium]
MRINPQAGKPAEQNILVNIPRLVTKYYTGKPDYKVPSERIAFGTSGHRGSSLHNSFNENHILAITQAICFYRNEQKIDGPLFLGFDTHALSAPAFATTMEVLAANNIDVMIATDDEYTPTPAISHAILQYNNGRKNGLADGIVITPSHNPPDDGGFKYNPTNGGPASSTITNWIEAKANELLENNLQSVKRIALKKALSASTTHRHDYLHNYIKDLGNVIDMNLIRDSKINIGVDPLGGAGVNYWEPIAEHYKLNLTVVNKKVDPTFSFMTVDWDGKIRMDPSSSYAMQGLIAMKDRFDISFACDTDHDRHGIVSKSVGLLNPNHYLSVAVFYLLQHRPQWNTNAAVGKTVVTTQLIDRIAEKLKRKVYNVPVGFKWFADGLVDGSLCFVGEESAGASFSRLNGNVWTTDKDGFIPALLSAEIMAKMQKDPSDIYKEITDEFGKPFYDRIEAKASPAQKEKIKNLSESQIKHKELAGETIEKIVTTAPGNNASIGGLQVITKNGWFAARPSGTEDIYKIYVESFLSKEHMNKIIDEAQTIVKAAI